MMKKAAVKEQSRDGPAVHVKRVTFAYTLCPAGGDIGLQINFRIRHGYVLLKTSYYPVLSSWLHFKGGVYSST